MKRMGTSAIGAEWVALTFLVVSIAAPSLAADGRILVHIVDEAAEITPARAWIDFENQRLFKPIGPETVTPYDQDRSFSCDGSFTMLVPAGRAILHVEKGKEYQSVDIQIDVEPNQTIERTVVLKRWIDMPGMGWYSADLHVHLGHDNPRVLKQLSLADDVHLVPSFTYWLRGTEAAWQAEWPDDAYTQPMAIDDHHIVTRNNIEIERIHRDALPGATIGATFLFNLKHPVTATRYGEHFPTDADLCQIARRDSLDSVFDSDKPSWAETVVGAALGMLDTVQIGHNHYYRSSTGKGGYGMIGPLAVGESNEAVGDGLFHRTNALYYRLLNCGFRLAVSGGSAIGVKAMPTGHHRVYAHIDGPLTADKMWASIKAGRSFVTTGPMLTLTANGSDIGSTIVFDSKNVSPIVVHTEVRSIEALESLEIVHNGHIVASRDLHTMQPAPLVESELKFSFTAKRSGWIAARALYRAPDGLLRQAHTSPIYLSLDNKPIAVAEDAHYMLRWLDQIEVIARSQPNRYPDADSKQAVLTTYAKARQRYETIVAAAQREWAE